MKLNIFMLAPSCKWKKQKYSWNNKSETCLVVLVVIYSILNKFKIELGKIHSYDLRLVSISMGIQNILQLGFTVIGIHVFIQLIMFKKLIIPKNEDFFFLERKGEIKNISVLNEGMLPLANNFSHIKILKFSFLYFLDIQHHSIFTFTNCLFCAPSEIYMCISKQVHSSTSPQVHFTNLSFPVHIFSLTQHSICEHARAECFSCLVDFLLFIFDFSQNYTNIPFSLHYCQFQSQ